MQRRFPPCVKERMKAGCLSPLAQVRQFGRRQVLRTWATEPLMAGQTRQLQLYSDEAFELNSDQWLKVGWNQKYPYTFSWMGRPIIQLPEDVIRIQEVICRVKPEVIIETGVAHGGSLVLYASLLKAMAVPGRVIGIDILIRPPNRKALEAHALAPMITLIQGDSVADSTVAKVKSSIK